MTEEQSKAMLLEVVETLKPIVEKIEKMPPSTKNHYGDYLYVLSQAPDTLQKKKLAAALILAGANKEGVGAALKLSL